MGKPQEREKEGKKRRLWWDSERYGKLTKWFIRIFKGRWEWIIEFVKDLGKGMPTLILFFVPVVSALIFMTAFVLSGSLLYIAIALATLALAFCWMLLIDFLHLPLIACHRVWIAFRRRFFKKNIYVCPYCHVDIWETPWKLPLHECKSSNCGEKHAMVQPSSYGIFKHTCRKCNTNLPAVHWLGKSNLANYCPICDALQRIDIDRFGLLPRLGIGIMGAPGAGKTRFMVSSIRAIRKKSKENGSGIKLADKGSDKHIPNVKEMFNKGIISPTPNGDTPALVFRMESKRDDFFMYMYDPAGKAYQTGEKLDFLRQVHGLVLVVDPSDPAAAEPVLGTVTRFFEQERNVVGGQFDIPLAVVQNRPGKGDKGNDSSESNLNRIIEGRFSPVRYFPGSASGSDTTGLDEPLIWLMNHHGKMK